MVNRIIILGCAPEIPEDIYC